MSIKYQCDKCGAKLETWELNEEGVHMIFPYMVVLLHLKNL